MRMRMQIIFVYLQGFTNSDYLAILASEVAVERPFNSGSDVLGLRRPPPKLVLLRDIYVRQRQRFLVYLICANNYE
ncbi:hypothetical protein V1517DRAFT_316747 [Lipomyces orientalis]|uniref:Uncharacterized protein n=1 Tax=Lipomyces orientalis TaxID=1233043 RepID=A0ACC3TX17_9ASCO